MKPTTPKTVLPEVRAAARTQPHPADSALGRWALIVGSCTAVALICSANFYWDTWSYGHPQLGKALWWNFVFWYGWAFLMPFIFWVCRRLARQRGWVRCVVGQVFAAAFFAVIHGFILTSAVLVEAWVIHTGRSWFNLWSRFILLDDLQYDLFAYAAIAGVWHTCDNYKKFKERALASVILENQLNKARLHTLRMQLHPHFIFNTLNGVASLNYEDPRAANAMLAKLSELLRVTLMDASDSRSLRDELEFNRLYLELEKMRLGARLSFHIEASAEALDAFLPTLLLQPLIENAVRHGIAPYSAPGRILIRASLAEGRLSLAISDNGGGLPASFDSGACEGIGLRNTRSRLHHVYGLSHAFDIRNLPPGGVLVSLSFPSAAGGSAAQAIEEELYDAHTHS